MSIRALLFACLIPLLGHAAENRRVLTLASAGKTAKIPFMKQDGVWVNDRCVRDAGKCEALRMLKNQPALRPQAKGRGLGNPASVFCDRIGGSSLTARDSEGNDVAVCAFKDHSLIDAWDLYRRLAGAAK